MDEAVSRQHAHPNAVYHCLYGFYRLGQDREFLARQFKKCERTITNWIKVYETKGIFERANTARERRFNEEHREWIVQLYTEKPLSYLDETQAAFKAVFGVEISATTIWRIIHEFGYTYKVLERRAMHIKEQDVFRFAEELSHIDWSHHNLVFLDEVSFDNRGMIRKRGYALKGKTLAIRGDFQRKPRTSLLAFIGVNGLIEYFDTEGTFDRKEFLRCCQDFVHSKREHVRQYPGQNSVWILDGASIHRHPDIVHYLRSVGVVPIFLPAYCPFYNPIEYLFGYIKKSFQRHYNESSGRDLLPFIVETFQRFRDYKLDRVFERCGWKKQGVFDPASPLARESRRSSMDSRNDRDAMEDLGYRERENIH